MNHASENQTVHIRWEKVSEFTSLDHNNRETKMVEDPLNLSNAKMLYRKLKCKLLKQFHARIADHH